MAPLPGGAPQILDISSVGFRAEPAEAPLDLGEREEVARAADPEPRPTAERLPALITTATVPSGTTLSVEFAETVASNTHSEGDTFRVRVTDDIREDGHVVIPAGSEIVGQVTLLQDDRALGTTPFNLVFEVRR